MDVFLRWAVAGTIVFGAVQVAAGAVWDVEVEMQFGEGGVVYDANAGLPLLAKLIELPLRDEDRVYADEVTAIRDAVDAQLGRLNRFRINGAECAPELMRFGIAGEKAEDGSYAQVEAVARFRVRHASGGPRLESVYFDWGLLPEKFFESAALESLAELLEPRDRSAVIALQIGNEPPADLEMRAGQADFDWIRVEEDFSEAAAEVDDDSWRGRFILIIVLVVLFVARMGWREYGEWSRRRRE